MKNDEIYHEEIPFLAGKMVTLLMATISIVFLILFIVQISSTSIGDNPTSNWYYLVMGLLFIGVTVFVSNLRRLIISINQSSVTASYGRISYRIALDNIESAFVDTNPGIVYGGWGIRMARIKGRSALIYNVIAKPRVVLTLRTGRFSQFAFSTRRPDEVIGLIQR
jgi:hypothetical protein